MHRTRNSLDRKNLGANILLSLRLVLSSLLLLAPCSLARAERLESTSFYSVPSENSQGGANAQSTTFNEAGSIQEVSISSSGSSSFLGRSGHNAGLPIPHTITTLEVVDKSSFSITLQWKAPVADSEHAAGTVSKYLIRYTTHGTISSDVDFSTATDFANSFTPASASSLETKEITGLSGAATYYFSVEAINAHGIRGERAVAVSSYTLIGQAPLSPAVVQVYNTSITVTWGLVDRANGFVVQASTRSDFQAATALSTSSYTTSITTLTVLNLLANTTYFLRAGALHTAATNYANTTPIASTATLTNMISTMTAYQVNITSITVNWPAFQTAAYGSSNTSSGYLLQASTASNFTGTIYSSVTTNVQLSTLTLTSLNGNTTYHFRVSGLNHNSAANFLIGVSTPLIQILGVDLDRDTIDIPELINLNSTTIISTSIVLTNTGNMTENYRIKAATITAGSPWMINTSQTVDRFVLWGVINSTQPSSGDFETNDKLSDSELACDASNTITMGNQTCVSVPIGETRTLWLRLDMPTSTTTGANQDIRVSATAVKTP